VVLKYSSPISGDNGFDVPVGSLPSSAENLVIFLSDSIG
jgi:hypothetical protein